VLGVAGLGEHVRISLEAGLRHRSIHLATH
jgi:hypothetical protein